MKMLYELLIEGRMIESGIRSFDEATEFSADFVEEGFECTIKGKPIGRDGSQTDSLSWGYSRPNNAWIPSA